METSKENWEAKLNNLHTREKGISSEHQIDYKSLLKKVFLGDKVLDVGCGAMWLKKYVPKYYMGIDAYLPDDNMRLKMNIEQLQDGGEFYDTICCFAALDGMRDLVKSISVMKELAKKNIVILTGINIEPDLYHTHLITEEFIDEQMKDWKKTVRVQVHPKIIFLEYTK
jgi:hypothetical protein